MDAKRWTKILMLYLETYEAEMDETKPVIKPSFMGWLAAEMKNGLEVVAQLDILGIDPVRTKA